MSSGDQEFGVSVIIPCYNGAATIGRQLQALAAQEDAPLFEVIVVLNGCTDDSEGVVRRFAEANPALPVRVEESEKGRCLARNHGVAVAASDVVAFCDADDEVFPDWLHHLADRTRELHGIVGGSVVHKYVNPPAVLAAYGIDLDEPDPALSPDLPLDDLSGLREAPEGNFAMWRADYLAVGGMDASFDGGLEGTDLCLRSQKQGIPVNTCRKARIHYWLRATPRASFTQQRALARTKLLFFVRHRHHLPGINASLRVSLVGVAHGLLSFPRAVMSSPAARQRALHELGGHLGSLEGHFLYRILRQTPQPRLIGAGSSRG